VLKDKYEVKLETDTVLATIFDCRKCAKQQANVKMPITEIENPKLPDFVENRSRIISHYRDHIWRTKEILENCNFTGQAPLNNNNNNDRLTAFDPGQPG